MSATKNAQKCSTPKCKAVAREGHAFCNDHLEQMLRTGEVVSVEPLRPEPAMGLDPAELAIAFIEVARLARVKLEVKQVSAELLPAPHRRPSSLPVGAQAVYAFIYGHACLKVGKAGPKTQARFTSQHYGRHAPSTLARLIIAYRNPILHLVAQEARREVQGLDMESIGGWLERNTSRFHLFLPASAPACALALAEAFVQCRLRPIYEGPRAG